MDFSRTDGESAGDGLDRPLLAPRPAKIVRKIAESVLRVQGWLGIVAVGAMALLLIFQVVVRYVIPMPFFWVEEVARLAMIWMTMLGVGYAVGRGIHLTVTAPTDYLPVAARRWFQWTALVLIGVVAVFLAIASVELVDALGSITASSSNLPRSVYFLASVVGYGLAVIQATFTLLGGPNPDSAEPADIVLTGENA